MAFLALSGPVVRRARGVSLRGSSVPRDGHWARPRAPKCGRVVVMGSSTAASGGASENPYRALGVAEDCSHEEVEAAFARLKAKHEDDETKLAYYEALKDRIFADKLQKRLSGAVTARFTSSPDDRKKPKKKFVWPDWVKKLVKKPEAHELKRVGFLMIAILIGCAAAPPMSQTWIGSSAVICGGALYQRGAPEPVRDEFGNIGEVQDIKRNVMIRTIVIMLLATALGFGISNLILYTLPLPLWINPNVFSAWIMIAFQYLASVIFYTQDI